MQMAYEHLVDLSKSKLVYICDSLNEKAFRVLFETEEINGQKR